MRLRPFDPERLLETLLRHRVRFVIIGGFAGRLFGSPSLTNDLDICYARDRKNLTALSSALLELHATLRDAPASCRSARMFPLWPPATTSLSRRTPATSTVSARLPARPAFKT
jgi:hypothetical protein